VICRLNGIHALLVAPRQMPRFHQSVRDQIHQNVALWCGHNVRPDLSHRWAFC
jgi:hypothetical protein